jgi:hypothetical protein
MIKGITTPFNINCKPEPNSLVLYNKEANTMMKKTRYPEVEYVVIKAAICTNDSIDHNDLPNISPKVSERHINTEKAPGSQKGPEFLIGEYR